MKNSLLLFLTVAALQLFSQAPPPSKLNYQAIARNAQGNVVASHQVKVRFTIKDLTSTGATLYVETDTATTNQFGLFTAVIGSGTVVSGSFNTINWGSGDKFLQVEYDPNGGNTYADLGTTQLMSVPYALYANQAASAQSLTGSIYGVTQVSLAGPASNTLFDARDYCLNLTESGFSDWKLPSFDEINYLVATTSIAFNLDEKFWMLPYNLSNNGDVCRAFAYNGSNYTLYSSQSVAFGTGAPFGTRCVR